MVEPGTQTGMPVLYDSPDEVGADRVVNGVAAFEFYGRPHGQPGPGEARKVFRHHSSHRKRLHNIRQHSWYHNGYQTVG